jgi:hypothetical protein
MDYLIRVTVSRTYKLHVAARNAASAVQKAAAMTSLQIADVGELDTVEVGDPYVLLSSKAE